MKMQEVNAGTPSIQTEITYLGKIYCMTSLPVHDDMRPYFSENEKT